MKSSISRGEVDKRVVGIDVSKGEHVVSVPWGPRRSVRSPNTARGVRKLARHLCAERVELVVLEATGRHERALLVALREQGVSVHLAHPKAVRSFAKALKQNAKSDPIDAEVLRLYGVAMGVRPTLELLPQLSELQDIVARREDLNQMLVQEKNRLKTPALHQWNKRLVNKTISFIKRQLRELEQLADELIKAHPCLEQRVERIKQEYGFGFINALTLVATVPELGLLNRNQTGALTPAQHPSSAAQESSPERQKSKAVEQQPEKLSTPPL